MKGNLDGTFLSRALLAAGKNFVQLASYNTVCGYDCRRVLEHVLKSYNVFRVVSVVRIL